MRITTANGYYDDLLQIAFFCFWFTTLGENKKSSREEIEMKG